MTKPLGDNWVTAEIDPFILRQAVGVRNASQADCEAVARKLTEQFFERDCNWTLIAQAYDSLHDDDDREDNPCKSGLPLGSVAIGAALGAAAVHLFKKRVQ